MRICMITSSAFPPQEGIGYHVMNLSDELTRRGHEVDILTRGSLKRTYTTRGNGARIRRVTFLPAYPYHVDVHAMFLKQTLHDLSPSPDVVHYHSPLVPYLESKHPSVATIHTPMQFDVPTVEVVDGISLGAKLMLYTTSRRIERKLATKSRLVATVCYSVSKELIRLGVDPRKLATIGTGVDDSVFRKCEGKRNSGLLLSVGRLSYRKGFVDLLEAFRMTASRLPEVRLAIVGRGPLEDRLKLRAFSLGLEEKVRFLGRLDVDQLVSLYQTCGAFVLPSHYEGLPAVLLEAMACGAPVIATSVGGVPDIVADHDTGRLVAPGNPDDLSKVIQATLLDMPSAMEMGERGRRHVLREYSWTKVTDRVESFYNEAIRRSAR